MSTSSTAPTFNGTSSYASQLQVVIQRGVSAQSAKLTADTTLQANLNSQNSELGKLLTNFQSLHTALGTLNSASGNGSYQASVDNTTAAVASVSSGVMAGTYTLTVASIGAQASAMSSAGSPVVTDPSSASIDSSSTYTLTADGQTYSIQNSSGTLNGLAQAINQSTAAVQATVVNVGSTSSPDYRLSVRSSDYSPNTIQLNDGATNTAMLNPVATGSYYTYRVNGQPATPINSSSNIVTLSPGLTATMKAVGTANITVAQNTSNISNALSSFVSAYNSAVDELTTNRGSAGGALSGQSTVLSLQSALQNIAQYAGSSSGSIKALTDLGVTFDTNYATGHLTFDPTVLSAAAATSTTNVMSFLGSESTGGFLQAASHVLTGITDSTTGMLPEATSSIATQLTAIGTKISADTTSLSALSDSLTNQMNAADATLSSLQNQLSEMTLLFSDMQTNQKVNSG